MLVFTTQNMNSLAKFNRGFSPKTAMELRMFNRSLHHYPYSVKNRGFVSYSFDINFRFPKKVATKNKIIQY